MPAYGFSDLRKHACKSSCVSVAGGDDPNVINATVTALHDGLVGRAIIIGASSGAQAKISSEILARIEFIAASDAEHCANLAVDAVRQGDATILMKGHIDSGSYLRAVVHKERGIRKASVLSNVTVAEMPSYPKLIAATDNGIVPAPTLDQKRQILRNTAALFHGLGRSPIKVAALAATEKVSDKLPATLDAADLVRESAEGKFPEFILEGPFGYDIAVSAAAADAKGLASSKVAGDVDLLLFHTIEAANAVAKSWKFHGQAQTGSIVLGAQVPVLLNSRSDDTARRINALLLALAAKAGGST